MAQLMDIIGSQLAQIRAEARADQDADVRRRLARAYSAAERGDLASAQMEILALEEIQGRTLFGVRAKILRLGGWTA